MMAFPILVNGLELLPDTPEGNGPFPILPKDLLSAHLKVILRDSIEDANPALIIGKDNRLLQISEEDLI
ncbi:MAG: hypothetical protein A2156_03245 [Deltaproteobacteria bacterium RBG_16_48_10]|nr:MAG: hypothetical protein A2156_03245 [Deltaproteobacteria bacterium RBG_16_48_10]